MADDDDWDVDLDAINNVSSAESRWGGTVGGSVEDTSTLADLRDKVLASDKAKKEATGYQSSYGYGGKFGVEKDRMDKSAVDASYKPTPTKHSSVADGKIGFGGKFGVQSDRQDKSAEDFSYKSTANKHASQKDYKTGFGGKFGVQTDRKDACAETWDYKAEANKHSSQTDASKGFGGKFGVQEDRKDASAHGWQPEKKVAPAKSKPKIEGVVSVGNIKSMFEKPAGADVSETIAKHRAARAEQDRRERELQARQKPTIAPKEDVVERSNKQPNRAEEARQLVAQSRVSAAASQFSQQPSVPAPVPERPKPTRVFNSSSSARSAFESNGVQIKPIVPKATTKPTPAVADENTAGNMAAEESRRAAESLRSKELALEHRRKEEEEQERGIAEEERLKFEREQEEKRIRKQEENRIREQEENRIREQAAKLREEEEMKLRQQEDEKLRLRNEEMKKHEQERLEKEAEERRLRMIEEEKKREEERLREEQRQMELEMERQRAEDEDLRLMEQEARSNENIVSSPENTMPFHSSGRGICAAALHDYNAAGDDEISFWEGDVITNIDTSVDANWWVGSCHSMTGLFPANYVEILPSQTADDGATANEENYVQQAVALYDYESEDPNDLPFQIDEVLIVERMETDDWWYGSIGDRQGLFPANHVELISR